MGTFAPSSTDDHVTLTLNIVLKIGLEENHIESHQSQMKDFFLLLRQKVEETGAREYMCFLQNKKVEEYCGSLREKLHYDAQFETRTNNEEE